VLNYVGATCQGAPADAEVNTHPAHFLNYDGHSGYDYAYPPVTTSIVAPAAGTLRQATSDSVNGLNGQPTAWKAYHTFYIDHGNGYTTWYLHCTALSQQVQQAIDANGFAQVDQGEPIATVGSFCEGCGVSGVSPHLHFEVRKGLDQVVDPYSDMLWSAVAQ
jgi:murein DD-endopeptidase MepM/ murein hydrolase activator NlpD